MGLMDILENALANGATHQGFDEVARTASRDELGAGLAGAMRSDQTPPFGDMVGQLFGHSDPNQRAGVLNQILATLGPAAIAALSSGAIGRILRPGQAQITPDEASRISPSDAAAAASEAEKSHPDVVDQVSGFYAEHSGLIKMLGGAALAITLAKMKQNASR